MNFYQDAALADFRLAAREWLTINVPREPRPADGPEMRAFDCDWQRRQYEGGWGGIDWAPEYGGRGLTPQEQIVWYEELAWAGGPVASCFNVALGHVAPTLILRGDEEQKRSYLPKILKGETPWCQLFSEPSAGSDLASLRTRGVIEGDELVVTGQKLWTTYANHAVYGEMLVRTNPDAPKHAGITWLIMDMRLPGIEIRPLVEIDGSSTVCEVFFDAVRVPLSSVVGGVDNGWSVAMATLAAERGPAFLHHRLDEARHVEELIEIARAKGLLDRGDFGDRLSIARAEAAALRSTAYQQIAAIKPGEPPSAETTAVRLHFSELQQRIGRLAIDIMGQDSLIWGEWPEHWLGEFRTTIAGGSRDILRNIIGERVMGLPR